MSVFDFNNNRAQNLSDPKFEKDSVNLRTLNRRLDTLQELIVELSQITVSLTAGQIQSGFTIPIDTGISLPGAGKAIDVVSASMIFTANTTPFISTVLNLIIDTALTNLFSDNGGILNGGVNTFLKLAQSPSLSVLQLVENKRLMIQTDSDSIGTGDGIAKIYILYRVITV